MHQKNDKCCYYVQLTLVWELTKLFANTAKLNLTVRLATSLHQTICQQECTVTYITFWQWWALLCREHAMVSTLWACQVYLRDCLILDRDLQSAREEGRSNTMLHKAYLEISLKVLYFTPSSITNPTISGKLSASWHEHPAGVTAAKCLKNACETKKKLQNKILSIHKINF